MLTASAMAFDVRRRLCPAADVPVHFWAAPSMGCWTNRSIKACKEGRSPGITGLVPARHSHRRTSGGRAVARAFALLRQSHAPPIYKCRQGVSRFARKSIERREADRARLAGLEDREVGQRHSDPVREFGQRHPSIVEQVVELNGDRHVRRSL